MMWWNFRKEYNIMMGKDASFTHNHTPIFPNLSKMNTFWNILCWGVVGESRSNCSYSPNVLFVSRPIQSWKIHRYLCWQHSLEWYILLPNICLTNNVLTDDIGTHTTHSSSVSNDDYLIAQHRKKEEEEAEINHYTSFNFSTAAGIILLPILYLSNKQKEQHVFLAARRPRQKMCAGLILTSV